MLQRCHMLSCLVRWRIIGSRTSTTKYWMLFCPSVINYPLCLSIPIWESDALGFCLLIKILKFQHYLLLAIVIFTHTLLHLDIAKSPEKKEINKKINNGKYMCTCSAPVHVHSPMHTWFTRLAQNIYYHLNHGTWLSHIQDSANSKLMDPSLLKQPLRNTT